MSISRAEQSSLLRLVFSSFRINDNEFQMLYLAVELQKQITAKAYKATMNQSTYTLLIIINIRNVLIILR